MTNSGFISVDWGTSQLRVRHVELPSLHVLGEFISDVGVKYIYSEWLNKGGDRADYFLSRLKEECKNLGWISNQNMTILISGMASSDMGLHELDYATGPVNSDGSNFVVKKINSKVFPNSVYLISGVINGTEVMRGEETQFLGLIDPEKKSAKSIVILPGTHSKHIYCSNGQITNIKTYMTGEVFEATSNCTILKYSIVKEEINEKCIVAFRNGVQLSKDGNNILNSLFKVRTNDLFKIQSQAENYYFLSGIIIGEEMKDLINNVSYKIIVAVGKELELLYQEAFKIFGLFEDVNFVNKKEVDLSVVKGQYRIFNEIIKNTVKYV